MQRKKKKYDKAKAHEYYMAHRKLKGKKTAVKNQGGKIQRKKKKKEKYVAPKNASFTTKDSGGKGVKVKVGEYDKLRQKLNELKAKAVSLSPEKKKALKSALNGIKAKRVRK